MRPEIGRDEADADDPLRVGAVVVMEAWRDLLCGDSAVFTGIGGESEGIHLGQIIGAEHHELPRAQALGLERDGLARARDRLCCASRLHLRLRQIGPGVGCWRADDDGAFKRFDRLMQPPFVPEGDREIGKRECVARFDPQRALDEIDGRIEIAGL